MGRHRQPGTRLGPTAVALALLVVVGGITTPALAAVNTQDKDCADFATQADAQAYFDARGYSALNDPERLDNTREDPINGIGDGVPCEDLPPGKRVEGGTEPSSESNVPPMEGGYNMQERFTPGRKVSEEK